jgi:alpha-tubulin suppressor-like RCC1 family protein
MKHPGSAEEVDMPDALFVRRTHRPGPLGRAVRVLATACLTLALAMSGGPDARAQGAIPPAGRAPTPLAAGPMVAAGEGTSFLLKGDGTVWSWGDQRDGRLGDGQDRDNSRTQPRPVLGLSAIRQIAIGAAHGLALRADGTVLAWGANGDGRLGNGRDSGAEPTAIPVPGLAGVVAVAAGVASSMALRQDGVVLTWGQNGAGQLGVGDDVSRPVPTPVPALANVRAIAAGGGQAFAIRRDGVVFAWGNNRDGQLGLGVLAAGGYVRSPRIVDALNGANAVAIAAGYFHTVALLADGSLRTFGASNTGQAGTPTGVDGFGAFPSPIRPAGVDSVAAVAAGQYHTLVLRRDGSALSWGNASEGRLGDGTSGRSQSSSLPGHVGVEGIVAIAAGERHSLVIVRDGTVGCFGSNFLGQCAQSQGYVEVILPTAVPGLNALQ